MKFLDKDGLRGTRIGVVRQLFMGPDTDPEISQLLENALADMKREGAEILEGVNIPDASVAVVLSGSGSTREHIQRLGRILRKLPDKEATLYEVVTQDTTEEHISRRRGAGEQFRGQGRAAEEPLLI